MKYLIIGAGGVGGSIAAFMADGNKDVSLIARGEHLDAMRSNGLVLRVKGSNNEVARTIKVPVLPGNCKATREPALSASDMKHYQGNPDVVILCTKGYALDDGETIPFLKRIAHPGMIIIPVLNVFGTGSRLQRELDNSGETGKTGVTVTDGCVYIAAEKSEPGVITMKTSLLRVVFGRRDGKSSPELEQVKRDLDACGINTVLSLNIKRDTLRKFAYISAAAGCGQYYDAKTGAFQSPGEIRDTFVAMLREMDTLATAMGVQFEQDIVAENLNIIDHLTPDSDTSMQRDIRAGNPSEIDGLVFQVVRLGDEYKVNLPTYRKIAQSLGYN